MRQVVGEHFADRADGLAQLVRLGEARADEGDRGLGRQICHHETDSSLLAAAFNLCALSTTTARWPRTRPGVATVFTSSLVSSRPRTYSSASSTIEIQVAAALFDDALLQPAHRALHLGCVTAGDDVGGQQRASVTHGPTLPRQQPGDCADRSARATR